MERELLDEIVDALPEESPWSLTEALPVYCALIDKGYQLPPLGWFFHHVQEHIRRRKEE
jgi:hypothetical protein